MTDKPKRKDASAVRPPASGNNPPPEQSLARLSEMFRALRRPDYGDIRKYMLDTDICVHLVEGHPAVAKRAAKEEAGGVVMSAVTLAELRYGALMIDGQKKREYGLAGLEKILEDIPAVPFDEDAALAYAHVRMADPKRNIRAMDKLIAAHAIALNLILVTNNIKDFQKFRPALRVENWGAAKR